MIETKCHNCNSEIVINSFWKRKGAKHFCHKCQPKSVTKIIKKEYECCMCGRCFKSNCFSKFCSNDCYNNYVRIKKRNSLNGAQESFNVLMLKKYFESNNIKYKQEVSFPDLKDKARLRFDFGIYQHESLICLLEYDGRQHFEPVWGGLNELEQTKRRDKMKDDYVKGKGIQLIRINYTVSDVVQDFKNKFSKIYPPVEMFS